MGRGGGGGGSFGGGGRSFGGGGGRSFGGRSGGGGNSRGGGSGFGGPSRGGSSGLGGGSSRGPRPPRTVFMPIFMSGRRRYGWGAPVYGGGGGGCCSGVLFFPFLIMLIIFISFVMFSSNSSVSTSENGVTRSTIQREPLPKGSVVETGYYTDELDWIGNQTKLTAGMKNFYQKTGVQPYLYITGEINGSHNPTEVEAEAFANEKYDELFNDEAHLLLIFFEYYESDYHTWYLCGNQAKTVIDSEAADILLDYIDKYYYQSMSDEEFFSKSFDDAAARIMTVEKSPWPTTMTVLGVAAVIGLLFVWWKNVQKQKNLEAERDKEILSTPLEAFGDAEIDDLAKKYESDDTNDN